jgi:ABC-type branched-subunit amino acid transport system substrate-binding protein
MTGQRANFISVGGYDGMHLICAALQKAGGNVDAVIAAMKGMAWESPRGPISIDPRSRDCHVDTILRGAAHQPDRRDRTRPPMISATAVQAPRGSAG